jgi:glycosyltransferase involved in cell wall biosynthesis
MKVWIVTIGEPVPFKGLLKDRLLRSAYFSQYLANHGHDVTWWASAFDHFRKNKIVDHDAIVQINDNLAIRLIDGGGYKKNISVSRIFDHSKIAKKFSHYIENESERPDIILASLPTIELCRVSTEYGSRKIIPVVLDMRDMWPDIFITLVPALLKPLARLLLLSMFHKTQHVCAKATAITGITEEFVNWGLGYAQRNRSALDRAFPLGYISETPDESELVSANQFWDTKSVILKEKKTNICFVGSLGHQLDIETIIKAANKIRYKSLSCRFIICGHGDRYDYFKDRSSNNPNIMYPGWVNAAQIYVLMRRSFVGLDPLPDRYDFHATINNKAIEYLSAGLPIISSPDKGVLADILRDKECGFSYPYGDSEKLANLILRLLDDREVQKKMSDNALRTFQERFTAEKVYKEMMHYLEEVIDAYHKRVHRA